MTESAHPPANTGLSSEDIRLILALRLLIARAANRDSLGWWDDQSLAGQGAYLLNRLFPVSPPLAGRSLALATALARHEATCASESNALHLYRLDADNQDGLAARQTELLTIPVQEAPIETMEVLRTKLSRLMGPARPYKRARQGDNQGLLIEIPPPPPGVSIQRHRAQTLAWAYLEGEGGRPVIPFILEQRRA